MRPMARSAPAPDAPLALPQQEQQDQQERAPPTKPPRRHVVTAVVQKADGQVLLVRRSQQVGTYQGMWGGVSGYVEAEGARVAICRCLIHYSVHFHRLRCSPLAVAILPHKTQALFMPPTPPHRLPTVTLLARPQTPA